MKVVHCKRHAFDVYIGRPSKWGNPFTIGKDGTREEVIEKYRSWIMTQPHLLSVIGELKGKVLGCWCNPKPCHGDVLVELSMGPLCKRCGKPFKPRRLELLKKFSECCNVCGARNLFDGLGLPTPPELLDHHTKRPTLTKDEFWKKL